MPDDQPLRPTITIATGDPAGIGPEVALKAVSDPQLCAIARWILIGDAWLLEQVAQQTGYRLQHIVKDLNDVDEDMSVIIYDAEQLEPSEWTLGRVAASCGRAGLEYVRAATEMCLGGAAEAIVTAPLNKEAVTLAGVEFCGHTEFIADLCGVDQSRMLLVNDRLRVVHVSTHCSLLSATRLETERILQTIELGHEAVVSLGWDQPRVAVCGLNPHAGENGMFGDDEELFILPAIQAARAKGIDCDGPHPADTLFVQAVRGKYDLVVAMYHDQGHVPMKLLDFEHTVNVTLGLPIIRTSVDHGTAFDIAGKNLADPEDMKTAMRFAVSMAQRKRGHRVDDGPRMTERTHR